MTEKLAGVALVLGSGCAQLFGLDTTSAGGDAPAMTPHVTAEVERMSIGATLQTAPEDLTAVGDTLAFLVADSTDPSGFTRVPATQGPTGTWSAPIADGTPAVDFTLGQQRHIWAFSTRDLKIADPHLEHPNPMPADPGSSLAVMVTLPSTPSDTETFQLQEIGPWLEADLAAPSGCQPSACTLMQIVSTSAMSSLGGSATPAAVIPSDVVLALRYDDGELTGVFQMAGFMETASSNPVSGDMTATAADQSFGAAVDPVGQQTRFAALRPPVESPSFSWSIFAAPYAMRNIVDGPQLTIGSVAPDDTAIAASYGNPFASLGWMAQLEYTATELRVVEVGGQALELTATATALRIPDASMPTLDFPAALPQTISIDDQPLSSDNGIVTLDSTKPATIGVVADRPSTQMYEVILYEVLTTATAAQLSYVVEVLATDPANLVIPGDVLVAGHTYTLWVACYADGFAGAQNGDLQTTSPPFDSASTYSGVFTVENP